MNKKTIITILLALVTMTGQAQTKNYTIRGNLSEVAKATAKQGVSFDSVTIMNIATNEVISKQTIQDGVFTINGTIEKPFYTLLCIWSSAEVNGDRKSKKSRIPIIIEPGDIMFDAEHPSMTCCLMLFQNAIHLIIQKLSKGLPFSTKTMWLPFPCF